MTTTAILTDEVFTGTGVSATMIPESDIYLSDCDLVSSEWGEAYDDNNNFDR